MSRRKQDFSDANAKTYRIKKTLVGKIKNKHIEYIVERKEAIDEAEVVNALIFKGLENLKLSDIAKYLELREIGEIQ